MATTTNYGWTTPDDTALVKDGASAIRSLGTSVDTTTKNLNPSTTLGDIEYRSSTANTNTRLGIGSTGQVLTVNGGVPSWATPASGGSMTLLSTTTLTGATTTISNIDQTYQKLYITVSGFSGDLNSKLFCRPNNNTTAVWAVAVSTIGSTVDTKLEGDTVPVSAGLTVLQTNTNNIMVFQFDDYASSSIYKGLTGHVQLQASSGSAAAGFYGGAFRSNTAITSLVFVPSANTLSSGTVKVYGVK